VPIAGFITAWVWNSLVAQNNSLPLTGNGAC